MKKIYLSKNLIFTIGCCVVLLAYCLACGFFQDVTMVQTLLFIVFELVIVYACGLAVLRFFKFSFSDKLEEVGFAYAVGYGLNIIIYMLVFSVFGRIPFVILMWVLGVGSIVYLFKSRVEKKKVQTVKIDLIVVLSIFAIILGFQFFVFALNNIMPAHIGQNTYYRDLFYWASDAVGFTKKFPPINFRDINAGAYHYHYFTAIQVAVASMCTGIDVFKFVCGFSFIQSAILIVLGSYIFFKTILKNKILIYLGMVLMLFSSGNEIITTTTPVSHFYTAPFGFDISVIFGLLAVVCIVKQNEIKALDRRLFSLTLFMFCMCLGSKGPVGVIVLLILGICCLHWVVSKENKVVRKSFVYGLTLLFAFGFIYLFIISGLPNGDSTVENYTEVGEKNSILSSEELNGLHTFLVENYSVVVGEIIFLFLYALLTNPAIYLLCYAGCIKGIIKFNKVQIFDVACLGAAAMGIMLTRWVNMTGFSQMYFAMSTFPFALSFGLRSFEEVVASLEENKLRNRVKFGVFCAVLCVCALHLFISSDYFIQPLKSGWEKLQVVLGNSVNREIYLVRKADSGRIHCDSKPISRNNDFTYELISLEAYLACEWIKDETPKDSIIATNLEASGSHYRLAVLAERYPWLEDISVVNSAARGDAYSVAILRQAGVDYLLLDVSNYIYWDLERIVYENADVIVVTLERNEGIENAIQNAAQKIIDVAQDVPIQKQKKKYNYKTNKYKYN